jgi:predicted enzyme related to lactoylglutathione lyase
MARLRHFAVCVGDLERSAKFYSDVFELKEVGRETIEIGSAIYMSDGVINLALLNFSGNKGNDIKGDATKAIGANHFGFQVDDLVETQKKIEAPAASSSLTWGTNAKEISSANSRIRMASFSTFPSMAGSELMAGPGNVPDLTKRRLSGRMLLYRPDIRPSERPADRRQLLFRSGRSGVQTGGVALCKGHTR